jgi:hypothetical protein
VHSFDALRKPFRRFSSCRSYVRACGSSRHCSFWRILLCALLRRARTLCQAVCSYPHALSNTRIISVVKTCRQEDSKNIGIVIGISVSLASASLIKDLLGCCGDSCIGSPSWARGKLTAGTGRHRLTSIDSLQAIAQGAGHHLCYKYKTQT